MGYSPWCLRESDMTEHAHTPLVKDTSLCFTSEYLSPLVVPELMLTNAGFKKNGVSCFLLT